MPSGTFDFITCERILISILLLAAKKCVASAISSVGEENEVFPFCLDGEGVACGAVEGALPPGGEVVDGVGEASGL